jgi:hypothetical protein
MVLLLESFLISGTFLLEIVGHATMHYRQIIVFRTHEHILDKTMELHTSARNLITSMHYTERTTYTDIFICICQDAPWRGAGVAVPVFSIRSDEDLGVGEFLDLKLLVDWAVNSGFHLVQLLPINDTSVHGMWWDSYPYRCW